MLEANFWQDKNNSLREIKEKKLYEDLVNSYKNWAIKINDLDDLFELALEEGNLSVQTEILQNICKKQKRVWKCSKNEIVY